MSETPKDAKGVFLAALDIQDPAERAALVERSCGGDTALRQRVENLLRAYGEPDGPLEKLAAALAPTDLTEPIGEQVGAIIAGRYKLLESLGQGGMGAVFMAQQTQPVKRVVALKLIKLGMDSKQVLARFEAERQALALMDHPNIAKVLDAGATDSGRPFFVMELVKGVPITRFCDERQLSPRQRLELFIPVCQAIQHAHQKGIIHRDIKPTNVLVALYDDRPVPKVIDFGVAKAAGLQLTDASLVTGFGAIVGTPEYMSPEQAQLNQLDIDTRSDVYALGVLLYELLTGTTPIDRKRLGQGALFEVLRIIREEEPLRPSTRLSTSDALASIAATRRTEPARLAKLMRGELDWIVMKCLEKDRSRRYETANGLAHDIERYLQDEVVEAQPPTAGYRLRKLASKHRKPVIALTVIMAVLVLGIVGTTWGLFRARQAEQEADTSKKDAIDALSQARKDRDAKEAARIAEAGERDRAERQLANGLLRPIGFSDALQDPAELRSFVDWSAIKESPLKLRVLEIALENPETALRVARRAEHVIQSCVGLSPTRRAQAVNLVSTRQRDMTADPRIRIAACWLALELGSADLPAWAESCNYLGDSKHQSIDRFGEFVAFAASRSDPQQVAQLNLEPLLAILDNSKDDKVHAAAAQGLIALVTRLEPAQVKRAWDALLAILEKSTDPQLPYWLAQQGLAALAPRLEPAQVKRACDALLAILEKSKDDNDDLRDDAAWKVLTALAPRLEPAQAKHAWDALIAKGWNLAGFHHARLRAFVALAPRLQPAQVTCTADALIAFLKKSKDDQIRDAALKPLTALAPLLQPAQVTRTADPLIAILEKSKDDQACDAALDPLTALAPRLEPAQAKRAGDALIAILEKSSGDQVRDAALDPLTALAPRLEPAQAKRAWDAALAFLENSNDHQDFDALPGVFGALAPRLEPAQVTRAVDALIPIVDKSDGRMFGARNELGVLVALARGLEPVQAKRVGDVLIDILEKSENTSVRDWQSEVLVALSPRLDQSQVNRAWDALLAILEKSKYQSLASESGLFVALAPRLEASQAKRGWDVLIAILKKGPQGRLEMDVKAAYEAFVALAPRLEPASRDKLSTKAMTSLLDYSSLFGPPYYDGGEPPNLRAILIARYISSPRSLDKLLSHPGCAEQLRQGLLHRFEELVFFDGKPMFGKADDASAFCTPEIPGGKQHRFHNLHDAAAWIQQSWPDFDLETSCPVTWPTEIHQTRSTISP